MENNTYLFCFDVIFFVLAELVNLSFCTMVKLLNSQFFFLEQFHLRVIQPRQERAPLRLNHLLVLLISI